MPAAHSSEHPTFEQGFRTASSKGEPIAVFLIWTPTCFDSVMMQFFGGPFVGERRIVELDAYHRAASELGSLLTEGGVTIATASSGATLDILVTTDQGEEVSFILSRPKIEHYLRRIVNAITLGHSI